MLAVKNQSFQSIFSHAFQINLSQIYIWENIFIKLRRQNIPTKLIHGIRDQKFKLSDSNT